MNAAGADLVEIQVRGGPEAIGMFQQPDALRDGIVDMVRNPGSFYGGALPEKDALVTSNLTAIKARQNGGIELIDQIHQEKMGVKYLGWFDSDVTYTLWTRDAPTINADGDLEVAGLKLRGNAVYNAFFTDDLGAQVIDLPTTDVYSDLEIGVVDATGSTQIGLIDLRWNEFLNYRIKPNFFSTDRGVIMNLEKWNSLSDQSKKILSDTAIQHEIDSATALRAKRDKDFAALEVGGMQSAACRWSRARVILATLYIALIWVQTRIDPSAAPAYDLTPITPPRKLILLIHDVVPMIGVMVIILAMIVGGIVTRCEAAAFGALGVLILAAAFRILTLETLKKSVIGALKVTLMACFIVFGSATFSQLLAFLGASYGLITWATGFDVAPTTMPLIMSGVLLVLGCFTEQISMMLLTVRVFSPWPNPWGST